MTGDDDARRMLLCRLLDTYEASSFYGRPGPWGRDVIVYLDARRWPEAFADDGREQLAALREAARALQASGIVRVTEHRGAASGEIRELRLSADEVDGVVAAGRALGFVPLADALGRLSQAAARLHGTGPPWLDAHLQRIERDAPAADLSTLGISIERFKRDADDVIDALRAAAALWRGEQGWERTVSERIFGDSKRISRLRGELARLLLRLDPRFDGLEAADVGDVLEVLGVRRKPGVIPCAGDGVIAIGPGTIGLADFTPTAHIPESWTAALIDAVAAVRTVTTVENEVPFYAYVEAAGGAAALGATGELVVYVAGFPAPHVVNFLASLAARAPDATFRHWGDADLGGLRIWWFLRKRLPRLVLFRTTAAWVKDNAVGARPLTRGERGALAAFRTQITESARANDDDAVAVIDALLRTGVRIEQERFVETPAVSLAHEDSHVR